MLLWSFTNIDVLLVPNIFRGSLPIERHNLHLPMHRNRGWQVTDLFIASLVIQSSVNRKCFPVRPKGRAKIPGGAYFQILGEAEFPLEHRHAFLDGRQIENFRVWI